MATTYGKLPYCNLNEGFLRCRPFQRPPRGRAQKPFLSLPCISSAVPARKSRSRPRLARHFWPISTRGNVGTGFGRQDLTRTTFDARVAVGKSNGSHSPTTLHPSRQAIREYSRCGQRRARTLALPLLSRNHLVAGACWLAAPDGSRGERRQGRVSDSLREAARVEPSVERRHDAMLRTTNRSWRPGEDHRPRRRARAQSDRTTAPPHARALRATGTARVPSRPRSNERA